MKGQQTTHDSRSQASAESVGKEGIGFKPPSPFARSFAPAVQRVGEAKQNLVQPDPSDRSADVPDLTAALVTELTNAKNDTVDPDTSRQTALDNLFAYLQAKNVIEDYPKPKVGTIDTVIVYDPATGGSNVADTQYVSKGNKSGKSTITIKVFATLFDSYSVPAIYSTFRHELIHAAQRTQSPDDIATGAQESDEYMHENSASIKDKKEGKVGKAVFKSLQGPLQEIETHVWEIEHAAQTGTTADTGYLDTTWAFIRDYTNELIANLPSASEQAIDYYRGYFIRAITQLSTMTSATTSGDDGPTLAAALKKAYNDKINARPPAPPPSSKSTYAPIAKTKTHGSSPYTYGKGGHGPSSGVSHSPGKLIP
jgi:hypothetical protein